MTFSKTVVVADLRWPSHTGIGQVQRAYIERKPPNIELIDLKVFGRIGNPLSPFFVAFALYRYRHTKAVFWNAGFVPPFLVCRRAIVFVHDLTHLRYYGFLKRAYYNIFLRPLYRRCAAVVCVSEFTRTEFLQWSGMDPQRVHVLRNGIAREFLENRDKAALNYNYIFYPGNHRSYKNVGRLIQAYAKSGLAGRDIHLLLTGQPEQIETSVIEWLGVGRWVHYCGMVKTEDMPKYYRGAVAVAFVSLYEGFGLPILEAMASDTPVVTSAVSAMPEVAGDAALVVDPLSVDAIADALLRAACDEDLRTSLIERGRRRVQAFAWEGSAERFWELIRKVPTD